MNHIYSLSHHRGTVLYANLGIDSIHLGDILTHRSNHQKFIAAHVGRTHILLVDKQGRISRIRKHKAIRLYSRSILDVHGRKNVQKALSLATQALISDNRLFTLLGFRFVTEKYLGQIEKDAAI